MQNPESQGRTDATADEVVDIEEHARLGKRPPKAARYRIRIDKTQFVVAVSSMTGRQLLELAGRTPVEQYKLFEKIRGAEPTPVGLDDVADFTKPGVEHYFTIKCDLREGRGERRDFALAGADLEYINATRWTWDAIKDGATMWLVIYDFKAPPGYTVASTTLGLIIPNSYPASEIDMAYFSPALTRTDGRPIPALADVQGAGFSWQRWSRHRHDGNRWRPDEDNLATHVCLIRTWIENELNR